MQPSKVPPLLVLALCALGVILTSRVISSAALAGWAAVAGGALITGGVIIVLLAGQSFRRAQTTVNPLRPDEVSSLVDTGVYRFSRNPMYLAMAMGLAGIALLVQSLAGLAWVLGFVWYLTRYQIKPEEAALHEHFGAAYEEYCAKVRRWI